MLKKAIGIISLNGIGQSFYGLSLIFIPNFISFENYGIAICILTFVNFCSIIATLGYDNSILYEAVENLKQSCVVVAIIICMLSSFFLATVGFLLKNFLFKVEIANIKIFFILYFLIFFSSCFENVIKKIYIQKGLFFLFGKYIFFNYLLRTLFPFLLIFFFQDWRICVYGDCLSYFISNLYFFISIYKQINLKNLDVLFVIKKHVNYVIFYTPSLILSNVSNASIIQGLNLLFGPALVGQFSFILRILNSPTVLIGRTLGVFFQKALSVAKEQNFIRKTTRKYKLYLGLASCGTHVVFGATLFILNKLCFFNIDDKIKFWPVVPWVMLQFCIVSLSFVFLLHKIGMKYKLYHDLLLLFFLIIFFGINYFQSIEFYECIRNLSFLITLDYVFIYFLIDIYLHKAFPYDL